MKTYLGTIKDLPEDGIFVFGSNTQGRHGKGAALIARKRFGAVYGQAEGIQGRSYAIVTKDLQRQEHPSISKYYIQVQIAQLYEYAKVHSDKKFYIAYDGSNPESKSLNGYTSKEMAQIFATALLHTTLITIPDNIIFEFNFYNLIKEVI